LNKQFAAVIAKLLMIAILLTPLPALAKGGVVLNFTEVDISTMVKFISDLTGKNFVMDDHVKGKISVYSPSKLSTEEAFNVFASVLELKGYTIVPAGKVYKIVPISMAKQAGVKLFSDTERGPVSDAYVAQILPLKNISAQDAVTLLQPIVAKDGYINSFGPANMILVVDSSLNIRKLLDIIELIDTEQQRDKADIVFLRNANADSVATIVREWLGSKDRKSPMLSPQTQPGGSTPTATAGVGPRVVADARLNALIVFGSDKDKEEIKKLVALIDVTPPNTSSKINVYFLENADATEVAKVLDSLIKAATSASQASVISSASAPSQSPFEAGKVSVTPDKATNSLVILASPTDYQNLLQVIQKLDKQRRQVFVQAMIAEVSQNKLKELGIEWSFIGGAANATVSTLAFYDPYSSTAQLTSLVQALITAGIAKDNLTLNSAANFPAVLKALQSVDAVNVLSTPTILTSDNKEAEIFVGENVPFKGSVTISNTTSPSFQSIDRKDTGIILKITPQISEGEFIKMDIYQEISAVKPITEPNATDVTTTKRSAKTAVVVKNQETVVIGGLIQDKEQIVEKRLPLLSDIPLLGYFFRTKSTNRDKTNLLILLTPSIIKNARDLSTVTDQQKARFDNERKRDEPFELNRHLNREKVNMQEPQQKP
jgi:general secretion pathway protein D